MSGLFGSRSSNTTQATTQQDNRTVQTWNSTAYTTNNTSNNQRYTDDHSLSQSGGSVYAGQGASVSTTDFGAVGGAFDFATSLSKLMGSQAANTQARAFDSVDSAVGAVSKNSTQAFDAIDSATAGAFNFGDSLAKLFGSQVNANAGRAFDTVDGAIGAVGKANTGALSFADSVTGGALSFAKTALSQASDAQAKATDLVATAYNDAKGRGALTDKIILAAIAGSVVIAVLALRK